ncbi:hypothetical protein WCE37_06570 [Luteimonas sp. MJ250]|uniref:hypothetical protein n=1 Tax=Luteimonas sp. MJ250 TaxID=3129236 RepID=UPI0031BB4C56
MDWDKMRDAWRGDTPTVHLLPIDELQKRDQALWKKVRRRDLIETIAAVLVAVFFALITLAALIDGEWLQAGFALLITAWGVALPFRLRCSRRLAPEPDHDAPLLAYLQRQRDATLAQARMLEQVWLWYLTPPAIGLAGLTLARDGATAGTLRYLAVMLVLYAALAWINRRVARTQFRAHAETLQRQIDALAASDA